MVSERAADVCNPRGRTTLLSFDKYRVREALGGESAQALGRRASKSQPNACRRQLAPDSMNQGQRLRHSRVEDNIKTYPQITPITQKRVSHKKAHEAQME